MDPRSLTKDFKEFLQCLNARGVDRVIRMGAAPNRIEIQTGIDGVTFAECYPQRVAAELDGVPVWFISLADLKLNKRAAGRNKDLADLDNLP